MRRLAVITFIVASAASPVRADYVYSILEHYIYNEYDRTTSSTEWPCTGLTLEGQLIPGECSQFVAVESYTDWRWVDLAGEITSPYPPGPWVEGAVISMLLERTMTSQDFSYWTVVEGVATNIGYQLGNPLVEDVKFDHALTRTRSPLIDPDPPPPAWPEPGTMFMVASALALGCIRARWWRKRK
jgi:hypothetical protein